MIKLDYELIDSGNGYKLERFGNNTIARPDNTIIWQPRVANWRYDAKATVKKEGKVSWEINKSFDKNWQLSAGKFIMTLKLGDTKNIGIFPEQAENWKWIDKLIRSSNRDVRVLNLFGYTGGASLAAASAGAEVCHVDASKPAINWFLKNKERSDMGGLKIRHIAEDCIKLAKRELKRGTRYDGIILDPPAFGRGSDGQIFKFEEHVPQLLELCKRLLKKKPLFVILNGYSMGYSPYVIANLLEDHFPDHNIECNDLSVSGGGRILPCGIYARFS